MYTDPNLALELTRMRGVDLAAAVRRSRRRGLLARRRRGAPIAGHPIASVVDLSPPRAGRDPTGRDRRVA